MKSSKLLVSIASVLLAISMVILPLVTGCAKPAPSPSPAPAPTPAPSPTPKMTITLKWAENPAPTDPRMRSLNYFVDRVREETNGGLELKIYPSEQLCKLAEQLEAVMRGSVDMTTLLPSYFTGQMPIGNLYQDYIFAEAGDMTEVCFRTKDLLSAEFQKIGLKYLFGIEMAPISLVNGKSMLKLPEDIKGLKIRAAGGPQATTLKTWGAEPVSLAMPEVYMAMQQGVIDGTFCGLGVAKTQRLWEVGNYWTLLNMYQGSIFCIVNMDTWNGLPDDYKKALEKVSEEMLNVGKQNNKEDVQTIVAEISPNFKDVYSVPPYSEIWYKWFKSQEGTIAKLAIDKLGAPAEQWWAEILKIRDELAAEHRK